MFTIVRGVDANDLTVEQCEKLLKTIGPALTWVGGLRRRMEETGWPRDGRHRLLVNAIYDALLELQMNLHYRACQMGRWGSHSVPSTCESGGASRSTTPRAREATGENQKKPGPDSAPIRAAAMKAHCRPQ